MPAERIRSACWSTVARSILWFAPGTTTIALRPSSATNIGASRTSREPAHGARVDAGAIQVVDGARPRHRRRLGHHRRRITKASRRDGLIRAASEVLATLRSRVAANALELARNGVPKAPFYVTGRIGERAFSVHAEGERMILKREGQERTEVDLGGPEAAELPLLDSVPARTPAEMPLAVCPDGSPPPVSGYPDVAEDEVGPGGSPLDAGLRRLEAGVENREEEPLSGEPGAGGTS